jgi:hypothetical protein
VTSPFGPTMKVISADVVDSTGQVRSASERELPLAPAAEPRAAAKSLGAVQPTLEPSAAVSVAKLEPGPPELPLAPAAQPRAAAKSLGAAPPALGLSAAVAVAKPGP